MLEEIIGLGASAASGGVLGVAGVGLKAVFGWLDAKNERAHALAMRKLDIDELERTAALQLQETEAKLRGEAEVAGIELKAAQAEADAAALAASYEHDTASYGGGFVDKTRGLMRPAITAYYMVLEAAIGASLVYAAVTMALHPSAPEVWGLIEHIVMSITFLAALAVTWWFGSRPISNYRAKQ